MIPLICRRRYEQSSQDKKHTTDGDRCQDRGSAWNPKQLHLKVDDRRQAERQKNGKDKRNQHRGKEI